MLVTFPTPLDIESQEDLFEEEQELLSSLSYLTLEELSDEELISDLVRLEDHSDLDLWLDGLGT